MRTIEEIAALGVINRQLAPAARLHLNRAVTRGAIKRQPCEVTGKTPAEAHHYDYAKPLEVIWLRTKEHGMAHRLANRIEAEARNIAADTGKV